jgi:hypothetical protein
MKIFHKSYIFFKVLLPYIISGLYIKWWYFGSHVASLCAYHVAVTDCSKLKNIGLGGLQWHNIHTRCCENQLLQKLKVGTQLGDLISLLFSLAILMEAESFVKS